MHDAIRLPVATAVPAPEAGTDPWLRWVEIGRVAAILAVISVHVASPLVLRTSQASSWWFGNLVESSTRWCVPVFVLISGALLLATPRTADAATFYRRRFARLGPAMVVWTVAYLVFGYLTMGIPRSLEEAVRSVLAGRPFYHLYFLFIIAGLYVVAPALRLLVERLDRRRLAAAVGIAFALAICDQLILTFAGIGGPNAITRWIPYVGFFLAGVLLRDIGRTDRLVRLAVLVAITGIVATALGTALLVGPLGFGLGRGRYLYEYLSVTTVPVSLALFALLVWFGPVVAGRLSTTGTRLVASAAAASFGIYLFHPMVLVGLGALGIDARAFRAPIAFSVTVALAFGISWAVVVVMQRLPILRALV